MQALSRGKRGSIPSSPALLSCPDSRINLNKLQLHPDHLCQRCAFSCKCKPHFWQLLWTKIKSFFHEHLFLRCSLPVAETMTSHKVHRHLQDQGGGVIGCRAEKIIHSSVQNGKGFWVSRLEIILSTYCTFYLKKNFFLISQVHIPGSGGSLSRSSWNKCRMLLGKTNRKPSMYTLLTWFPEALNYNNTRLGFGLFTGHSHLLSNLASSQCP